MELWTLTYDGIQIGDPFPKHLAVETHEKFSYCFKNLQLAPFDPTKKRLKAVR